MSTTTTIANTMSTFAITYLWNKKEFTSEYKANSVEEAIEGFKSDFYSCNQVRVEVISAQKIVKKPTNTMQKQLTEEEMFKNNLYNFDSIESLNDYLNENVLKVYPDLKGYATIIMRVAESNQKEGKDLVSILLYASCTISRLVNRSYLH
jgi:hypothetical protein